MTKKVLIILGHPSRHSFCGGLADSYKRGALEARAEVREIAVGEMDFDLSLRSAYKGTQPLEPDLVAAQESIRWADHLVWVYPTWWGTYPAVMKGFIDRILLPGFAFKYRENSPWWDRYLTGRSARLIITLDAPVAYNWLKYGSANQKALKKATLEFCGVKPVRVTSFGQVKFSSEETRRGWHEKVRSLGLELV